MASKEKEAGEGNPTDGPEQQQSNKYERNVTLVLDNVIEGFGGLFSP